MMPDGASDTVERAMALTGGRLHHVVTHSAVRWWERDGDETNSLATDGACGLLSLRTDEFSERAMLLPAMQFTTAQLLMPRLYAVPNATYTFVTGGAGEQARSPLGQINAQAVWGLAAALRQEARVYGSEVRVSEVRVSIRFNRDLEERRAEPRDKPLSHDLGHIVAGLAAAPSGSENALHNIDSQASVGALRQRFSVADKGYAVYYSPEDLMF